MTVLKAKTVITADGDRVIDEGAVLIDNEGKIEAVGSAAALSQGIDAEPIDYGDATLMPGLIDMHVHLAYWQTKSDKMIYEESPSLVALLGMHELRSCLSQGVTTIRTVTDPPGLSYALRAGLLKGFIDGPRYITSNKGIGVTGGHASKIIMEADGVDGFRRAVRQQIKEGADWIKLMASHRGKNCELTQEEMTAAVEEAHSWGKKCCVHAGSELSIERAINAGMDSIEHGTFMTVEQARRARDKGIAWVPTIVAYTENMRSGYVGAMLGKPVEKQTAVDKYILAEEHPYISASAEQYKKTFGELAATGIKIAAGTDMIFEHLPLTPVGEELLLMNKYGMAPMDTIQCATANAAEILGIDHQTGRIRAGLDADLLVVDGDLTQELENIRNISAVYRQGRPVFNKA